MSISHFKVNNAPTTGGGRRTVQILLAVVHSNVTSLHTSWLTSYSTVSAVTAQVLWNSQRFQQPQSFQISNVRAQLIGETHGCNLWVKLMGTDYGYQPQPMTLTFPSLT